MPPIPKAQWTAAQQKAATEFTTMRGQEVFGPFAVMLRSPEVMLRAAAMGDYMRYRTSLPPALNELIILITARHWSQQFEWYVHQPMALKAGLAPQIVAAVSKGRRPDAVSDDETAQQRGLPGATRQMSVEGVSPSRGGVGEGAFMQNPIDFRHS